MLSRQTKNAAKCSMIELLEDRRLMSVTYGSNLILNPGAEAYSGTADGFNMITPNHWTANGNPTVVQYDSGYGSSILVRKPGNGGDAFFAGGPTDESDDFFQNIDLSSISAAVDAGQVSFTLGALIGGRSTDGDNATVSVNFRDASETAISEISTASVSAGDRDNRTKFIGRTRSGTVPADARFAQIQIHFKRDDGSYNDGFADNLSLVLTTNTPSTVGITPTILKSTFKSTVVSGQKINAGLLLSLANTSTSINKGADTISLFASSDGAVDSSSTAIATANRTLTLGAGKSTRLMLTAKTVSLPAGTYTIFAQTRDSYGTVVTTASGPTINVVTPMVSLSASVGPVSPASTTAAKAISFTLTLQNGGNIDSTGVATIALGLSSDGSTVAVPLTPTAKNITIKAGGRPVAVRIKVKLPIDQPAGIFEPIVSFTQSGNTAIAVGTVPVTIG